MRNLNYLRELAIWNQYQVPAPTAVRRMTELIIYTLREKIIT